ncbi:MAG: short-subunit dehydrogenase [bacterium]
MELQLNDLNLVFKSKYEKVLVTGASGGLGKELVKELNKRGYEVIVSARNVKYLDEFEGVQKNL